MLLKYYKKNKRKNDKMTLNGQLSYWQNVLMEKCLNIFEWTGLPSTIPQKEIEVSLILLGYCGVVSHGGELWATMGSMSGVTPYPDEFKHYIYATPLFSGGRQIDTLSGDGNEVDNVAIISNNYSRLATYDLIKRYAYLLAHADLTYQSVLINCRATGIMAAKNQQQADSINTWYNKLVQGDLISVVDDDGLNTLLDSQGLRNVATQYPSSSALTEIFRSHDNILRSFFNDIGLPMSKDKREREIESETKQDNARILFNVNDMLKLRKMGCDTVNRLFGTNWSVKLSSEYSQIENNMQGGDVIDDSGNADTNRRFDTEDSDRE